MGVVVGVGLPALAMGLGLDPVWRFGGLLLILNGGVSIGLGHFVATRQRPWWLLLVFPVFYFIGASGFLPGYTRYFALVYLCLSYLAYGLTVTAQAEESKN
ncbi:hypothetical protein [Levilactobacillus suantsaii]|nr:hypothetical protein [Levilactobacillus suantsaii]